MERGVVMRLRIAGVVVLGLLMVGCAGDPTTSDEYVSLEKEVADLERQLAEMTAERDQLLAETEADSSRFETVQTFTELRNDVATDPSAYGTEDEVLALLSDGAAPGAVMADEAYGSVPLKEAWRRTLFAGNVDAVTTEWRSWICSDGRLGGSLWTWEGSNFVGDQFSLVGINLNEYDDEGRMEVSTVIWPYPNEYVYEEFGVGP